MQAADDARIGSKTIMDIETAEAVDTLRTDIRQVETSLTGEIHRVETSVTGEILRVETSLTGEIHRVETSLTAKIETVRMSLNDKVEHAETSLTAKMLELHNEAKGHANIGLESVRDDIRAVAEAVVALGSKVDALRR